MRAPLFLLFLSTIACKSAPLEGIGVSAEPKTPPPAASPHTPAGEAAPVPITKGASAEVGKAAPPFALPDVDGKIVRLDAFKGKTVVLEWFNPECPFVRAAHTKGSLQTESAKVTAKGIVWLAINSGAKGKQGFGAEKSAAWKKQLQLNHPILLDESGEVGHAYGATNTPHMFVIDDKGVLVYRGAIDNSPDGEGDSPQGGKLVNYVDATLEALAAGKPPTVSEIKAYGCSVKY